MIHIHDQGEDGWLLVEMDEVHNTDHACRFQYCEWHATRKQAEKRKDAIEAKRKT
jgi:hypothetical protein